MCRSLRRTTLSAALVFGSMALAASEGTHWGYFGDIGPAHWGDLNAEFATCKQGQAQSPINIGRRQPASLGPLRVRYRPTGLELVNNGHTVQVNVEPGSSLTVEGKEYELKQFHFHTPSEHTLLGRPLPLEIHFVHQAQDGALAVIGVFGQNSYRAHPALDRIWAHLPTKKGDRNTAGGLRLNPVTLLPDRHDYVAYDGSLTTPPCSEGVRWIVLQTPLRTTRQQIRFFSHLIGDNARPAQPLNGRQVSMNR
jgi:carbonic anhydrase